MATSRRRLKLGLDTGLFAASCLAAYLIRFEGVPPDGYLQQLFWCLPTLVIARLLVWHRLGLQRRSWRHFGLSDAVALGTATASVSLAMVVLRIVAPTLAPTMAIPLGVIVLEGLLVGLTTCVARALVRSFDEAKSRAKSVATATPPRRRALLVGAGRTGRMAAAELHRRPGAAGYRIVGFLDDDPRRTGEVLEGVPVLGTTAEAGALAASVGADLIILTIPSATGDQRRRVYARCQQTGLEVRTVPAYRDLVTGRLSVSAIRPLSIEDLLGRDIVRFKEETWAEIHREFAGKRVLVTGAGGSIGSEICRQLAALDPALLILVDNTENNLFDIEQQMRERPSLHTVGHLADIRDLSAIDRVFEEHQPHIVFHAAAYKHVPMMERHPCAAVENNVGGTRIVAEAARRHRAERFLLISTDKAVDPTSIMGATKRAAELVVASLAAEEGDTAFCSVRFGNVLGSRGSVLHTFRRQIEAGGPVTVTHPDMTRFFMTIPEAVRLVIAANACARGGEVFVLDMGEPVKIVDLAEQMIQLASRGAEGESAVEIAITGLRPGEKLSEALWRSDESVGPAPIPGILAASAPAFDVHRVRAQLWAVEQAAAARETSRARIGLRSVTSSAPLAQADHARASA